MRNIRDNKVSGQLSSNSSNHNVRLGSDNDYMNVAHRLGNEVMQTRYPEMDLSRQTLLKVLINVLCSNRRMTPP